MKKLILTIIAIVSIVLSIVPEVAQAAPSKEYAVKIYEVSDQTLKQVASLRPDEVYRVCCFVKDYGSARLTKGTMNIKFPKSIKKKKTGEFKFDFSADKRTPEGKLSLVTGSAYLKIPAAKKLYITASAPDNLLYLVDGKQCVCFEIRTYTKKPAEVVTPSVEIVTDNMELTASIIR